MKFSRRQFLASAAVATTTSTCSYSKAAPASAGNAVRIAVVGLHKGQGLINDFAKLDNVKIVALCDVDSRTLNNAARNAEPLIGKTDLETDYRRLLDRKDIDAVVLATPNHWHSLQTIWACQAGKDVYVEKPCSHSIWEGRKMIEAARKYNRIVQVGLQASSNSVLPEAAQWIREGNIGKIQAIYALWYKPRASIGNASKPLVPPEWIDYDLWLGPAEDRPLFRNRLHYDWHWDWNTGNGDIANIGCHVVDIARYFLGDPQPPKSVTTFGNRFQWNDAGNTPNMHVASFNYEEAPVILEVNNFHQSAEKKTLPTFHNISRGQLVICEGGELRGHAGGEVYDNKGQLIKTFKGIESHQANFIEAVISRRQEDLFCEIERGHASCSLPLLGALAYRVGEQSSAKEIEDQIGDNQWLSDSFRRYQSHATRLGIDLKQQPWVCCSDLTYDSKSEKFVGSRAEEANLHLRRDKYRDSFVVPEVV